ncbi:MAG TPA: DNA polymerase I [Candidatus Limnocylindria bacterium]|nr:DNA polymerase I [Candidatus Limnocylindria bacterium]
MNKVTGKKVLAIIDGKSVFYRGYYAMPNLSKKDGTPTGGVFGFASMALEVMKRLDPDYVCVAWDKPKTNIRRRLELYPAYKAGRKPAPPDFHEQIPLLHKLLEAFGWPLYELDDYEADDIMGSLAVQAAQQDIETMLITSDMDMLQLVDPHIHVFALKTGLSNIELYSPKSFEAKYGIKATQFLDLKALKGDSSDNIPGVPGIGEKGALELLKAHQTLDGVYENIELIKDNLKKKLVAGKASAYLSKELAAIWTDAPIKLDLKKLDMAHCEPERVKQVLTELEFGSLVRRLPEVMQVTASEEKAAIKQSGLKSSDLHVLDSAKDFAHEPTQNTYFALAAYADPQKKTISHLALANEHGKGSIISAEQLASPDVQKKLQALQVKGGEVVTYDAKALIKHYWTWGADVDKPFDVMIAAFLLNSLTRDQSLAGLAREWLDLEIEAEELDELERLRLEMAVLQKLHSLFKRELAKKGNEKLQSLFDEVEMPLTTVLASMEREGIQLDTGYLAKMHDQITDRVSDLEQQIYGHADTEFNIGSPAQLADILFTKLQLPTQGIKKGKTGYSTAASELDKLRGLHPMVDLISQWREVTKLKNTYVDTLPKQVDENSRLHTTYALTVAATGRLSSNEPNLQNIPVRTELGKQIRTAFVADPGNMLVSADYSQQELRLAAYLAGDEELIEMFNQDVDVHVATAAEVYGRTPEDITKSMRRDAKVVNFGVMYGLSTHGLVAATGMTYEQAKHFIEKYFEVRPKLVAYIASVKEQAKKDRYTETIMGRRRPTPDVHSSNFVVREAAMRAAVNMPFQGSAADIMKLAMVRVGEKLQGSSCKILLQIHDSLIVECPEAEAEKTAQFLKETMEGAYKLPIKLTVDTSTGKNWGEL